VVPIVCFEGPSAVGKTTTAAALADAAGAAVVPEVNLLFDRPPDEPSSWYFERQVDRWALASAEARRRSLVVLDGDPFQPLWYNWSYDFVGWQGLDFLERFYRPRILAGQIDFPDLYFLFGASPEALRSRKENDPARLRRGFEHHLRFVEPQRRYFEAMRDFAPERVRFHEAREIEETVRVVSAAAKSARPERRSIDLFDHLVRWLGENRP
jgi:thymidylate kinase